jgi:hypothetical protein
MAKLLFILFAWVACGIAAAGIWNAAMYANFQNCGRQGAEDQGYFLIKGIVVGRWPWSWQALLDSDFGRSGWSLSTHKCAQPVQPYPG